MRRRVYWISTYNGGSLRSSLVAGNNDVFWGAVILANLCLYHGIKLKEKEKKTKKVDKAEPGIGERVRAFLGHRCPAPTLP